MTPEEWEYRQMSEATLKGEVVRLAHDHGWIVFHLPMTPQRRPARNASGYPDLTLARDGEVLFLELKRQTEDLDAEQRVWRVALGRGFHVIRPSDLDNGRVEELLG